MAVYTDVDRKTLKGFLADNYDLGELEEFAGIPEGVQNTNYYVKTEKGKFILTLFERRTPTDDLPYFCQFMDHLGAQKFPCPVPIKTKTSSPITALAGKPAILVTFLSGGSTDAPTPEQCFSAGEMIATLHKTGKDFKKSRDNLFSAKAVKNMFLMMEPGIAKNWPGWEKEIRTEVAFQATNAPTYLPIGTVHADIFPDNVFFEGNEVTGLIDFYFTCSDYLAYDLAISLCCWCFTKDGTLKEYHFHKMLAGYENSRLLEEAEKRALPIFLRRAALSFLMTRIEDVLHPPPNILGVQKDPKEFMNILAYVQNRRHIEDYG